MNGKRFCRYFLFLVTVLCTPLSYASTVWIDVRTQAEHFIDSIEGDVRISYGDIVEEVSEMYPNKDTDIHLYCRSGRRASAAMAALRDSGYTNVSNIGSIENARSVRGLKD